MKKIVTFIITATMLFSMTACARDIEYITNEPEPTAYPVMVDELVFEQAPATVASLSPAITEIIFELGYGDKLIGRSKYCDYPAEAMSRADIGSSVKPSFERILALKPELIITQSPIAKTDRDALAKNGTKVLIINTPNSYDELMECYETVAEIFGGKLEAKTKANACMNELAVELSNVKKSGTFAYIMTYDYGTATGDTLAGEVLSYFGENVAGNDAAYNFSAEQLIAAQPDAIVLSQGLTVDGFDAEISELFAVRSGRIIYIDSTCFERPTARRVAEFVRSFGEKTNALPEMKSFSEETAEEEQSEEIAE